MKQTNLKAYALLDRKAWFKSHPANEKFFSDIPDVIVCNARFIARGNGIALSDIVGYTPSSNPAEDRLVISNDELKKMFAYIEPDQQVFRFRNEYQRNLFLTRYKSVPEFESLPDVFVIQGMYIADNTKQRVVNRIAGWRKPVRHISSTIFTDIDIHHCMEQLNTYPNGYSEDMTATDEPEVKEPEPVYMTPESVEEVTVNVNHIIDLSTVYKTAKSVKPRTKESVALHLGSEAGEINECLVQPQRGGNIVEESVDAILCALDLIYLELGTTHGTPEISRVIQALIEKKCEKWAETCKK